MVAKSAVLAETTSTQNEGFALNYRVLGTLGMIASPFLLLSFVAAGLDPEGGNRLSAFLGLIFAVGWFSNVAGLWQLRATGYRLAGRIVLGIELVGISIASMQQVFDTVMPGNTSVLYTRLFLSPKTVRNYISSIFSKLQVADRAEAIARAREAGMGEG